jgi:hypothetical protein
MALSIWKVDATCAATLSGVSERLPACGRPIVTEIDASDLAAAIVRAMASPNTLTFIETIV